MYQTIDFSSSELCLFSEILWDLNNATDKHSLRENTIAKITQLLRADIGASYVWNPESKLSQYGVAFNIDQNSLKSHNDIWQHDDPITYRMREVCKPTIVDSVIPRHELENSDYYNEFLRPNKMHYGINVYFVRHNTDVGDLRIWREKSSHPFNNRECTILDILEPYFTQALPNSDTEHLLTPRECEIVNLVVKGLADKEIATLLGIEHSTVRTHLKNLFRKMNCTNRTELSRDIFYPQRY